MKTLADAAEDYFSLPPLSFFCTVAADDHVDALVAELEEDGHSVRMARPTSSVLTQIELTSPDVVILERQPDGDDSTLIARQLRHLFGRNIVLIGIEGDTPTAAADDGLFDHRLARPLKFTQLAQQLGLVPDSVLAARTVFEIDHRVIAARAQSLRASGVPAYS